MKNVMVIDGADNCAYDVFAATDEEFAIMFAAEGQDVAFVDEIVAAGPKTAVDDAFKKLWSRPVDKKTAVGLHGTLFYELDFKKQFYPNRRDSDLTNNRSRAQG
jgi:hypothetical protein